MSILKIFSLLYQNISKKKFHLLIACFCILLNWAGHSFVYENTYRFLTFDMIGTFVSAITLGSVWAIIVSISTSIVLSNITAQHFIYFATINMTGAIFWGWLAETGCLTIINSKTNIANNFKRNSLISGKYILFAAITTGLVISISSSIIKNVVFQDTIFKQPYSVYFTDLFRNLFDISNSSGILSIFANYIATTFIEIPNAIITVFVGSVISLTILKYNTIMLTQHYERKITKHKVSWISNFLSTLNILEIIILILIAFIYVIKIKSISNNILGNIIFKITTSNINDILFLEIISIPFIAIILILFLKVIFPNKKTELLQEELSYLKRTKLNRKEFDSDITKFIFSLFVLSTTIVILYLAILIHLTGITPIKYYYSIFSTPVNTSNLLWLIILICIFILIDKYNNSLTRNITMENELIKKQTIFEVEDSYETQRQKLQTLELNWSNDTIELLRSSRHDLINQLEKTKTGFNDILEEVYEKVVKKYKDEILENQRLTREHLEDLRDGKLTKTYLEDIQSDILQKILLYNEKLEPYISITADFVETSSTKFYCYTNRLLFIAINNIIDNSICALQKLLINDNFKPFLNISIKVNTTLNTLNIIITDNAGGLKDNLITKIYKQQIQSSKGERYGEGTIHCAYFIGILNGTLRAKNIYTENNKGLETNIILPIHKEQ